MPNWVTIELCCKGSPEDVSRLKETVASVYEGEPYLFDFDKIIPQPEGLFQGNVPMDPTPEMLKSFKNTGYYSWYEWNIEHWGTKWGCSDVSLVEANDREITYGFQTAWSFPDPVILKLSTMFPFMSFEVKAVEEGGYFAGDRLYMNGVLVEDHFTSDNETWLKYAKELTGYQQIDEDDEELTV